MQVDPKSAKKTYGLTVFLGLLGSECIKAAHKMLVKLTPGGHSVNALRNGQTGSIAKQLVFRDNYISIAMADTHLIKIMKKELKNTLFRTSAQQSYETYFSLPPLKRFFIYIYAEDATILKSK